MKVIQSVLKVVGKKNINKIVAGEIDNEDPDEKDIENIINANKLDLDDLDRPDRGFFEEFGESNLQL